MDEQKRPYDETLSVAKVLKETFFPTTMDEPSSEKCKTCGGWGTVETGEWDDVMGKPCKVKCPDCPPDKAMDGRVELVADDVGVAMREVLIRTGHHCRPPFYNDDDLLIELTLASTRAAIEADDSPLAKENGRLRGVLTELVEVARLRGDNLLPHPSDDPELWTARMQEAWDEAEAMLEDKPHDHPDDATDREHLEPLDKEVFAPETPGDEAADKFFRAKAAMEERVERGVKHFITISGGFTKEDNDLVVRTIFKTDDSALAKELATELDRNRCLVEEIQALRDDAEALAEENERLRKNVTTLTAALTEQANGYMPSQAEWDHYMSLEDNPHE